VWDTILWRELATLLGHGEIVWMCAWSPNGTRLASASSDKTVTVWNPNTGREVGRLAGHSASVFACAWSPDGARLVGTHIRFISSSSTGSILLVLRWDYFASFQ